MKPFTVRFCVGLFRLLRKLTPLMILRTRIIPAINPSFRENSAANDALIEIWSLGGLVLSIAFFAICLAVGRWSWYVAVIFGWLRVGEIVIVQINVLLFDGYGEQASRRTQSGQGYALVGYLRSMLLLLQNYAEIIVWFAVFYAGYLIRHATVARPDWFDFIGLSFFTMTTFGQDPDKLAHHVGDVLPFLEAVIGLFMLSAVLARFVALLPAPGTMDEQEHSVGPNVPPK